MTNKRIPGTAGPTAPAFKHGRRSAHAVAQRKAAARLSREVRALMEEAAWMLSSGPVGAGGAGVQDESPRLRDATRPQST